ncbi:MAG TPA: hypothetical protein VFZ24_03985 [Longimicrobiales bacterium]
MLGLVLGTAVTACASGGGTIGAPDALAETRLEAATAPARRAQIFFDWNMTDRDARFSGRGVLRLDTTGRARVDLFAARGETLAAAVLEGETMRVAPANAATLLPPPALLWASLGVFRRPSDAPLTGTAVTGDRITLEYTRDRTVWRFQFQGERLRSTEWTDGTGRRTVVLTGEAALELPEQAVFRDWTEFRELTIRVTEVEEKAAFEPDVWILPGER